MVGEPTKVKVPRAHKSNNVALQTTTCTHQDIMMHGNNEEKPHPFHLDRQRFMGG